MDRATLRRSEELVILRYDDPAEEAGLEALRVALAARSATGAVREVALLPPTAMAQVAKIVLEHGAREREARGRGRAKGARR